MIETKGLTGAQTMLRVLGKMGVEKIFASPGSEWSPLWEALAEPGVEGMPQYYSTRHEEIAVAAIAFADTHRLQQTHRSQLHQAEIRHEL